MSKVLIFIFWFILSLIPLFAQPSFAATLNTNCLHPDLARNGVKVIDEVTIPDAISATENFEIKLSVNDTWLEKYANTKEYQLQLTNNKGLSSEHSRYSSLSILNNKEAIFRFSNIERPDTYSLILQEKPTDYLGNITAKRICELAKVNINDIDLTKAACSISYPKNVNFSSREQAVISVNETTPIPGVLYTIRVVRGDQIGNLKKDEVINGDYQIGPPHCKYNLKSTSETFTLENLCTLTRQAIKDTGNYTIVVTASSQSLKQHKYRHCAIENFEITNLPTSIDSEKSTPIIVPTKPAIGGSGVNVFICTGKNCTTAAGIPCNTETGKEGTGSGIMTAIGCTPTDPTELIKSLLKLGISVGGGIAFLLMVAGSFQMITSAGNTETLKKGHEQFTNAIIGLLFIIFSVLLFKIIGVDILNIDALTNALK